MQEVRATLALLGDDLVILLADADHVLLVLSESFTDVFTFFGCNGNRVGRRDVRVQLCSRRRSRFVGRVSACRSVRCC